MYDAENTRPSCTQTVTSRAGENIINVHMLCEVTSGCGMRDTVFQDKEGGMNRTQWSKMMNSRSTQRKNLAVYFSLRLWKRMYPGDGAPYYRCHHQRKFNGIGRAQSMALRFGRPNTREVFPLSPRVSRVIYSEEPRHTLFRAEDTLFSTPGPRLTSMCSALRPWRKEQKTKQ